MSRQSSRSAEHLRPRAIGQGLEEDQTILRIDERIVLREEESSALSVRHLIHDVSGVIDQRGKSGDKDTDLALRPTIVLCGEDGAARRDGELSVPACDSERMGDDPFLFIATHDALRTNASCDSILEPTFYGRIVVPDPGAEASFETAGGLFACERPCAIGLVDSTQKLLPSAVLDQSLESGKKPVDVQLHALAPSFANV